MGAGCRYVHNCNKELAAWVEVPERNSEYDHEYAWVTEDFIRDLTDEIGNLGYEQKRTGNDKEWGNGLFDLFLEYTYSGEGIVIRLEPRANEWEKEYNLAMANHARSEKKILRHLDKCGYKLRIATGGYTSTEYKP